ncbi:hypothetical protein AMELA_G00262150 [Ameiurus melas]|uniref:Torsin-1A-interacting protein 1/2 AAA+ activator domain-containing protein n=1 Tax=Ameiurus melas TaxID=219545 RepID=A0A7J5ZNW3_AMEME|nr:hypothetical protein AMELA_G00262150 [Ameiurus melas]
MNGQDTEQPEDTDTRVHNQQTANKKDTAGVRGQSDAEREVCDKLDGKCIKGKNENNEVPHAAEGPRLRRSNEKQKIGGDADSGNSEEEEEVEWYPDDDIDGRSQEEDCGVTSSEINQSVKSSQMKPVKRQDTEQPEDTDTRVHNQQTANKKDTAGVRGQSDADAEREDCDKLDGKCIKDKNENNEVPHAAEGPRLRRSNEKQKIGGDADSGNSEEEEVEWYPDDDIDERSQEEDCGVTSSEINQSVKSSQKKPVKRQDTEQPEDTDTRVHNQQTANKKDTAGVRGQSDADAEREVCDKLDGKCIKDKNENNEVPHAAEGPRLRRSNEKQKIAHLGEGDICGHVETKRIPIATDTSRWYILFFMLALVMGVFVWFRRTSSPPLQKQFNLLEVFCQEMDKVKANFPSQHHELWRRSRIHLQKHLNLTDPTEPVSLILTSGRAAEKTLGCLAHQLAAAFSNAFNSSVLGIDGYSKRAQGSDDVKMDIDKALKEAFEGGTQAAVIHRFEELPPGSTLIFYRYCDHENSAFKKVFLAFTVLLQEEMDFPPNVSLGLVEESKGLNSTAVKHKGQLRGHMKFQQWWF